MARKMPQKEPLRRRIIIVQFTCYFVNTHFSMIILYQLPLKMIRLVVC